MMLLTKAIINKLPKLYAQDGLGDDAIVYAKLFDPTGGWTWYILEFDGEDTLYGLVKGFESELGYFSLSELSSIRGKFGLGIERDLSFKPCKLSEVRRGI